MSPAAANNSSLCSDSQTTCGTKDTSEDSAAPAPSATSSAGIAQQTSVLEVANRLAREDQSPDPRLGQAVGRHFFALGGGLELGHGLLEGSSLTTS